MYVKSFTFLFLLNILLINFSLSSEVFEEEEVILPLPQRIPSEGVHSLVIFATFHDKQQASLPDWIDDIFDPNLPNSLRHFYYDQSRLSTKGRHFATGHVLDHWVVSDSNWYPIRDVFIQNILEKVDQEIDFSIYDNCDGQTPNQPNGIVDMIILIIYDNPYGSEGYLGISEYETNDTTTGGENIKITSASGIRQPFLENFEHQMGIIAHEYGHAIGFEDLYDSDRSPAEDESAGIGLWGLYGEGYSINGLFPICWYNKRIDGWIKYKSFSENIYDLSVHPDTVYYCYIKRPRKFNRDRFYLTYRDPNNFYNQKLPSGLLIWHNTAQMSNRNEYHKKLDVECADGLFSDKGWSDDPQHTPQNPNPLHGGDNLDFYAKHFSEYTSDHNGNMADITDPFDGITYTSFTPYSNPNSNAHDDRYNDNQSVPTNLAITNIRQGGVCDVIFNYWEGDINENTTWTAENSPYYIGNNISVKSNVTLEIEAGTTIEFGGNYMITIEEGATIMANGTESDPILFCLAPNASYFRWKYLRLRSGGNEIKHCTFTDGTYPLYLYKCPTTDLTNIIESCTFLNNTNYGIRIYKSKANVTDCIMENNQYYGIDCYNCPEVQFYGNHITNNRYYGVRANGGNYLLFEWTVIENNGWGSSTANHGFYTYNGDNIYIGMPYSWPYVGYNTIKDNYGHEVCCNSDIVCLYIAMSSIHDDSGYELYNYNQSGSPQIFAQNCWFGEDPPNENQLEGSCHLNGWLQSEPDWDGETSPGGISKVIITGNDDDSKLDKKEKIKQLKSLIKMKPTSKEAKDALLELYSIIRADFLTNSLNENEPYIDFLNSICEDYKEKEIGKKALRYLILWNNLENDDKEVIKLSEKALKELEGEDRFYVLYDLTLTYAHTGQLKEAKKCLNELKDKYNIDEDADLLLEEDIKDIEQLIAEGEVFELGKRREHQVKPETRAISNIPKDFNLFQNYPNPFNPSTTIKYGLPESVKVTLKVYNIIGKEVATLVDSYQNKGYHQINWEAASHSSGLYFYYMQAGEFQQMNKMILMK